eukprot:COSAG06_NODE_2184_length_7394_cov_363.476628_1_plen_25_part_10
MVLRITRLSMATAIAGRGYLRHMCG